MIFTLLENLIKKIEKLEISEKVHILDILKTNEIEFTKNENGYFFNLLDIDHPTLEKINECVDLIMKNKDKIILMNKKRNELIESYKTIVENRLKAKQLKDSQNYFTYLTFKQPQTNIKKCIKKKEIKRKYNFDYTEDYDTLMKEYSKMSYKKNTVYHRMNVLMKNSRKKCKTSIEDKESDDENFLSKIDFDGDNGDNLENGDIVDVVDVVDEVEEYSDDYDNVSDNLSDVSDTSYNENALEEVVEENQEDEYIEEDKINDEMEFYKKLLVKEGFSFDEDKNCMLIKEDYIK